MGIVSSASSAPQIRPPVQEENTKPNCRQEKLPDGTPIEVCVETEIKVVDTADNVY